jgi:hypothetical protein
LWFVSFIDFFVFLLLELFHASQNYIHENGKIFFKDTKSFYITLKDLFEKMFKMRLKLVPQLEQQETSPVSEPQANRTVHDDLSNLPQNNQEKNTIAENEIDEKRTMADLENEKFQQILRDADEQQPPAAEQLTTKEIEEKKESPPPAPPILDCGSSSFEDVKDSQLQFSSPTPARRETVTSLTEDFQHIPFLEGTGKPASDLPAIPFDDALAPPPPPPPPPPLDDDFPDAEPMMLASKEPSFQLYDLNTTSHHAGELARGDSMDISIHSQSTLHSGQQQYHPQRPDSAMMISPNVDRRLSGSKRSHPEAEHFGYAQKILRTLSSERKPSNGIPRDNSEERND